jgi:hypothetical protein
MISTRKFIYNQVQASYSSSLRTIHFYDHQYTQYATIHSANVCVFNLKNVTNTVMCVGYIIVFSSKKKVSLYQTPGFFMLYVNNNSIYLMR